MPAAVQRSQGRPAAQLPEPWRLWIRHTPRHWPLPHGHWLDAASGRLGRTAAAPGEVSEPLAYAFAPDLAYDDTVYLPPVPEGREGERLALAGELARAGTPVLLQLGSAYGPPPGPGVTAAFDLLPVFLGDEPWPEPIDGAGALWPLLPGISDRPAGWRGGLARLAGFAWVQGMEVQLSGGDRRFLLERAGEGIFDALYHRRPAPGERERAFAAAVASLGLAPFAPRPLPRSRPAAGNRRLAAALLLAGELWLRLGRPPSQGQAFFRAARFVDGTAYDVAALAGEGNLGVIPALDEASRRLLLDEVGGGGSLDLAALREEYLAFSWEGGEE